jgi:ribosomal protein S18 acetylase RimI-like enzyme
MRIRRAKDTDLEGLNSLLRQVLEVHHTGRPDLFKGGVKKYTDEELFAILRDESTPVFAAVDENERMLGYAFCVFVQHKDNNILTDVKTLYIDDLCVDESTRGTGVGRALYDHVVAFAKAEGCYNLTLNVWACNEGARRFYEKLGLVPQKYGMETILDKNN